MNRWYNEKLGKHVAVQTGPFGSLLHASDYVPAGIPSIMPVNIGLNRNITFEKMVYIKNEDAQRLSKYLVQEGDIIYSRRGNVEKCAFISKKESGWLCGTGCLRLRVKSSKLNSKFLSYYLSSNEIKAWVSSNAVGTTMPNLNSTILGKLPVLLPAIDEQKSITSVLSSLDDKIDLLHWQNKTLESMAETLFRQWFVEKVQDDWDEKTIGEIFTIKGGTTPSTKDESLWDGDINWTSPRDLSGSGTIFLMRTERKITGKGLCKISSGLLPQKTLLMSSRAPIGYLAITDIPVAINQGYIAIMDHTLFNSQYMYLWCKSNMEVIKNSGNGSVFQEISKASFRELSFVVPPKQIVDEFNYLASDWFTKIKINTKQIQTLEKLRDTLLPKLMSGEVRVRYEAEPAISAV